MTQHKACHRFRTENSLPDLLIICCIIRARKHLLQLVRTSFISEV